MKGPDNKYAWTATVGQKGQIVIPKEARDKFNIKPGDSLVVFGKEKNEKLILLKEDLMREYALKILDDLDEPE